MITVPTSATGSATGANDSIDISTPRWQAIPAMTRFELVPISVTEPARVVTCATGSSTSRAGMRRDCSSCRVAGISIATIGVVLISAEATPIGHRRRRSACRALAAATAAPTSRGRRLPVWTTPLAITSIAATVITPALESPANSSWRCAMRSEAGDDQRPSSARSGSTRPDAIATRVATTSTAATEVIVASVDVQGAGCSRHEAADDAAVDAAPGGDGGEQAAGRHRVARRAGAAARRRRGEVVNVSASARLRSRAAGDARSSAEQLEHALDRRARRPRRSRRPGR